jgi:hypothetical protein
VIKTVRGAAERSSGPSVSCAVSDESKAIANIIPSTVVLHRGLPQCSIFLVSAQEKNYKNNFIFCERIQNVGISGC